MRFSPSDPGRSNSRNYVATAHDLVAQALLAVLLVVFLTYRVMGRNYDAAVIAAGQCGFQLGATPTAIANLGLTISRQMDGGGERSIGRRSSWPMKPV